MTEWHRQKGQASSSQSNRQQMSTPAGTGSIRQNSRPPARPSFVVLVAIAIAFVGLCLVNVHLATRLKGGGAGNDSAPSSHFSSLRYSNATGGKNAPMPAAARGHDVNDDHFRRAGMDLDAASMRRLLTWSEIKLLIGMEAVVLGLDTHEDFREKVPPLKRMIGSAGIFNSGTNLVSWTSLVVAVAKKKHSRPVPNAFFQAIIQRNMGQKRWWSVCPHLVYANSPSRVRMPVPLEFKFSRHSLSYKSLAHLWIEWYAEYWRNADGFPFLIVRLEDLVFHRYETTRIIVCECTGGTVAPEDDFKYIVNSAKIGPAHGKKTEWTDMVDSWVKYGKPMAARANFSDLDYDAAVEFLSRELMEKMCYKYPPSK
jgi:hypothetical protein